MFRTNNRLIAIGLMSATAVAFAGSMVIGSTNRAADPQLAHMVFFKLKDNSGANRAKLIAACKLYLTGHEGTEYFGAGSLATDMNKEVNDRDFDVSLHLVFKNKEAHDKYQESERHVKFIEENKDSLEKVRVFDSYLSPAPADDKAKE
jgi:Stress responsive A/B Barrel Domain